jgi:3'(2'), 5'-bisphosphate nucleotidase
VLQATGPVCCYRYWYFFDARWLFQINTSCWHFNEVTLVQFSFQTGNNHLNPYLNQTIKIAQEAGSIIAKVYHQSTEIVTGKKADASFVTEADIRAHDHILARLTQLTPEIPVISEEIPIPSFAQRQHWKHYWSVDPLDGTYEFVHRKGEFVVSIALIEGHYPVLGVIYMPLTRVTYFATATQGAFKIDASGNQQKIQVLSLDVGATARVLVSRRRKEQPDVEAFLAQLKQYELIECSSAIKFCLIAEGSADIYPRFGTTHEWDIAAGQCILEQAGGSVVDLSGKRMSYNTKESLKNGHFVAKGGVK